MNNNYFLNQFRLFKIYYFRNQYWKFFKFILRRNLILLQFIYHFMQFVQFVQNILVQHSNFTPNFTYIKKKKRKSKIQKTKV